jgi:hypothetical protein
MYIRNCDVEVNGEHFVVALVQDDVGVRHDSEVRVEFQDEQQDHYYRPAHGQTDTRNGTFREVL